MARVNTPDFWEDLYARGGDGWELGRPAPPLADVLETTPPPRGRVAVPGCGRGHDARLLAAQGYEVTGFDFAPAALAAARALAERERVAVTFESRDVFALGRELPHAFDGVWEYTCFCAIDPARRAEYVDVLRAILKRGATLLACFYPLRNGDDGPPFPVSRAEVERLLAPHFAILESAAPAVSIERRRGLEWLIWATRL